ncbi:protein priA [Mycena albidolilacea]|uniref:Protein priA n=1 Tax=Mycena albidolilacea TaxID=1033008 RepID=A0AAD7EZN3_9AGAR|nr:protein priA [Mycena albidolilacea]
MTLITRLGAALVVLAAALPFAASTSVSSNSCRSNEFWYESKGCCLPHGGPPAPPPPPKGHDCPPSNYYWNTEQGCCTPAHPTAPNNPPPQCRDGWTWYSNLHMCLPLPPSYPTPPPSHPSGGPGWKRHAHKRSAPLCPTGLDACPIPGLSANDYECIDTAAELESCGGCLSLGQGQDCTAITGAWNVGCEQGRCAVYTCTFGFKRAPDGQSCIPL